MSNLIGKLGFSGTLAAALILSSLAGSSAITQAQTQSGAPWVAGSNYQVLPNTENNPEVSSVAVVEVFGYFCPHCFHLDAPLQAWRMHEKPGFVHFSQVPVIWQGNATTRQLAQLYYTLVALHRDGDLHAAVFNEIHVEHHLLMDQDGAKAEILQAKFLEQHGVSGADFAKAYHSPEVAAAVAQAEELGKRYRVLSVPTLVIAEKYTTDAGLAGSEAQLFALINDLAAREHKTK